MRFVLCRKVAKFFHLLIFLAMVATCVADTGAYIFAATPVQGLKPFAGAPEYQMADFNVTCTAPLNHPSVPGYGLVGYTWANPIDPSAKFAVASEEANSAYVVGIQTARSTTVRVFRPGVFTTKCWVRYQKSGEPDITLECDKVNTLVAIGGPIILGQEKGGSMLGRPPVAWAQLDGHPTKPWYMQYFGYSHAAPPPPELQTTQDVRASVLSQPEGTRVIWNLPPITEVYVPGISNNPSYNADDPTTHSIRLQAEAAFAEKTITCAFQYTYAGESGPAGDYSCADDTQASKAPIAPSVEGNDEPKPAEHLLVNKITSRKPHVVLTHQLTGTWVYNDSVRTWASGKDRLKLLDSFGTAMPGVFVQEYWPNVVQDMGPNFVVNTSAQAWDTRPAIGLFHATDNFSFPWLKSSFPNWGVVTSEQRYYAATVTVGVYGMLVGTFNPTFTPPTTVNGYGVFTHP